MNKILPQAEELLSTLKQLMPSIYQQETLESVLGLFLSGQGKGVPHHCPTKSESAISRFLNHYKWSTRSLIRYVRSCILNLILSHRKKGRKPNSCQFHTIVGISKTRKLQDGRKVSKLKTRGQQVYLNGLDIPVFLSWVWLKRDGKRVQRFVISTKQLKGKTIARWGRRRWQIEGFFKTVKHCFSLHRFGQKTLLGVYRWLILSFVSYLLSYWVYLHLGDSENLDWFFSAQQALILLLPHILILSLLTKLETVRPWLNELGFDFSLIRCKI